MTKHARLCALLVFFAAAPASGQSTDSLAKGEIFVSSKNVAGSDVPMFLVTGVVDAPPERVYELVTNCDRFVGRLPRVLKAAYVKKSTTAATCRVTIDVPFPLSDLTAVTQDERRGGPDLWYRKWSLVEGDYHINSGSFVLSAFEGDAQRTLVKYSVHAVPKTKIPDFLREKAQRSSLPNLIERMREEVAK